MIQSLQSPDSTEERHPLVEMISPAPDRTPIILPKNVKTCHVSDRSLTICLGASSLILILGTLFLGSASIKGVPKVNILNQKGLGYILFELAFVLTLIALGILGILVCKKRNQTSSDVNIPLTAERIRNEGIDLPSPSDSSVHVAREIPYHHVARGLYIGRDKAVVKLLRKPNRAGFHRIITVCPLMAFLHKNARTDDHLRTECALAFHRHRIVWNYVGKTVFDGSMRHPDNTVKYWEDLVFNCTFPGHELSQLSLLFEQNAYFAVDVNGNITQDMNGQKSEIVRSTPASEWFEPIFRLIDKAMAGEEKILVHCQAGESRSATLLAAYLIKRFNVDAYEAIKFLCSRRNCVRSKFMEFLYAYQHALSNAAKIES